MSRKQVVGNALYTTLLFVPFGFWILGVIIGLKALKTRDFSQFKQEIKAMFYYDKNN